METPFIQTPDITQAMRCDQFRLGQQYEKLRRTWQKQADDKQRDNSQDFRLEKETELFLKRFQISRERRLSRRISRPLHYPENLPISGKSEAIKRLLQHHQVIVVGGETGSGKSTQLPKICFELGLSEAGLIAHTQPRRIAARTLSQRIQQELSTDYENQLHKDTVACKVRFSDSSSDATHIKLMTDGVLLAEIEQDPFLEKYQCIIIDEVHERTLNIDFLLAYLKGLLRKRPDLKLILTSATIDLEKVAAHFDDAPIVQVSGRTFPVSIDYLDVSELDDELHILEAVHYIQAKQSISSSPASKAVRDILVFLPTEKDIRFHSKLLRKHLADNISVLPLYGRMPLEQQNRIFQPTATGQRIILATNVAETSITVPNIAYVIDSGLARVSRYHPVSKVQRLPIEKISKANARQRAGRCGRIAPGLCVRLYTEEDFEQREDFLEPEIQRSNLSAVLLKLAVLKLGDIESFPLLDKPDTALIKDARWHLFELEAMDKQFRLLPLGKRLSRLAIDPAHARILLEAGKRGCLAQVLVIVTGLAVNDPRLRPQNMQQKADELHKRYRHPQSDFLSYLNLWCFVEVQRQQLSRKRFQGFCRDNFLSFNALSEWRDLHRQLQLQLASLSLKVPKDALKPFTEQVDEERGVYAQIHQSILKGRLSGIAQADEGFAYRGIQQRQVYLSPASVLFKSRPSWIVAAELVETSRLYAHCCASIDKAWILSQASHVLNRRYYEPFWSKAKGSVQIRRQSIYKGLIIEEGVAVRANRDVCPDRKEELHEIFIHAALIDRQYKRPPKALRENWRLLDKLEAMEQKSRGEFLTPTDTELVDFYRRRIPDEISDVITFERYLKTQDVNVIHLSEQALFKQPPDENFGERFPDEGRFGSLKLDYAYRFEPGKEYDGLSIRIPYQQLNQLHEQHLHWLVPGLLPEKCEALLRALPKHLRKQCLPIQDTLQACLERIEFGQGDLLQSLAQALHRSRGIVVAPGDFDLAKLPRHLRAHIAVFDEQGKLLATGDSPGELREQLKNNLALAAGLATRPSSKEMSGQALYRWDFGDLPVEQISRQPIGKNGEIYQLKSFPALSDEGDHVCVKYFDQLAEAQDVHRRGQLRLMVLSLAAIKKRLLKRFKDYRQLPVLLFSAGDELNLFEGFFDALVDTLMFHDETKGLLPKLTLVYRQDEFERLRSEGESLLFNRGQALLAHLEQLAKHVYSLRQALDAPVSELRQTHHQMIRGHLESLLRPGFLTEYPLVMIERFPLYVETMQTRLERLQGNIERDAAIQSHIEGFRRRFRQLCKNTPLPDRGMREELQYLAWLLEEYTMHSFVQTQKTVLPVSAKKLERAFAEQEAKLP